MEKFAVPQSVVSSAKRKRRTFPPETISQAVGLARQVGAQAAAFTVSKDHPAEDKISEETIRTWLSRWRKEGSFGEQPGKRGRRGIVDAVPGAKEEWLRQVEGLRAQGESVTGRVSAAIIRGVLEEKAPSLLERHGGSSKVCIATGANFLVGQNMSYRKKTSSRIIPPVNELADARGTFFIKTLQPVFLVSK